jgi:aspartate aminotransferase/aminotransferase
MPSKLIADRMQLIDASGIRKVFDLAARLKDPIDLSIGQPDFDVPDAAKEAAIDAIRKGFNRYTQTQGIAELRQALARQCRQEFGWRDERPYLITSGVSGALMLAMLVLVNPGDEVVLLDPYFVMYKHLVNLVGGKPVLVDTYPDFAPNIDRIAGAVTDRTKLLVLNSPCNPTGSVYSADELKAIAQIARKHDLLVISDECYNLFCYDGPFASLASYHDKTLLCRGFSKTLAMTGWRMGWCTGPEEVVEKMTMLQQYSFVCAPSMAQVGALAGVNLDMSHQAAAYRRRRDMVFDLLGKTFGLAKPAGTFYAFVPAPAGMTGSEFCAKAISNNVLIIPGNVFSQRDTHWRMAYTVDEQKLRKGLEILVSVGKGEC